MNVMDVSMAYKFLYPRVVTFITSSYKGKKNIMVAAWVTPASFDPPLIAISISPDRYSHDLIKKSSEFGISIPTFNMKNKLLKCGSISGRDIDKFKEFSLTPVDGSKIGSPLIKECPINIECKVRKVIEAGDHTLFIGEVVDLHYKKTKQSILIDKGGRKFMGVII